MPLNPPEKSGLRRLANKSNDIARVAIVVPAGDELEVSEYVAGQLVAQSSAFTDTAPAVPVVAGEVEEAGGGSARGRSGRRKD